MLSHLPSLEFGLLRQILGMEPRLASTSQSFCLCLPSAGMTGVCHHIWLKDFYSRMVKMIKYNIIITLHIN